MRFIKREHGWIVNIIDYTKEPEKRIILQYLVIAKDESTACSKFLNHAASGVIHRPNMGYEINKAKYII